MILVEDIPLCLKYNIEMKQNMSSVCHKYIYFFILWLWQKKYMVYFILILYKWLRLLWRWNLCTDGMKRWPILRILCEERKIIAFGYNSYIFMKRVCDLEPFWNTSLFVCKVGTIWLRVVDCVELEEDQDNVIPFGWCDGCVGGWFGSPTEICVTMHGFTCVWN